MIDQVKEALENMQSNVTEAVNGLDDALTKVEDRVGVLEARVRELESLLNDQRRSWMSRDHRKVEPAATEPTPAEPAAEAAPLEVAPLQSEHVVDLAESAGGAMTQQERKVFARWVRIFGARQAARELGEGVDRLAVLSVAAGSARGATDRKIGDAWRTWLDLHSQAEAIPQQKQRKPRAANGSYKLVGKTVLDAANKGSLTSPFSRAMAVDAALPRHADVTPQIVRRALQELVEAGTLKMSGERAQARYSLP
jgi:hypothetical protein